MINFIQFVLEVFEDGSEVRWMKVVEIVLGLYFVQ